MISESVSLSQTRKLTGVTVQLSRPTGSAGGGRLVAAHCRGRPARALLSAGLESRSVRPVLECRLGVGVSPLHAPSHWKNFASSGGTSERAIEEMQKYLHLLAEYAASHWKKICIFRRNFQVSAEFEKQFCTG